MRIIRYDYARFILESPMHSIKIFNKDKKEPVI